MSKTAKAQRVVVTQKGGQTVAAVYEKKTDPKPKYVVRYRGVKPFGKKARKK